MKIFKNTMMVIATFVMLLFFPLITQADEEGIGFEIKPLFPSTQIDKKSGYYYIQTEPGKKQTLDMTVYNIQDKDITVEFIIENAISTSNGNIDYSSDIKRTDKSLIDPITDIVIPNKKTLTLKPKEEVKASFEVTPPNNSYDGIKMGRVVVREKDDKKAKGIVQKYQYGVGIITSETGDLFNDGDKLNLGTVKPTVSNGSKVVVGELVNPLPKTIENLQVRSYITKKGDTKKIKERNIDNFSFAPNSKVEYKIPWGLTNFESGEYTFHFDAKNDFETFELKKDFKITGSQASDLNKKTAFKVSTPTYIKIILVVMNIVLVLIFLLILYRNKKWENELKIRRKKKNKKTKQRK